MSSTKSILNILIALTSFSIAFFGIPEVFRNNPELWNEYFEYIGGGNEKLAYFITLHLYHLILFVGMNSLMAIAYISKNPKVENFKTEKEPWPWHSPDANKRNKFTNLFWSTLFLVTANNLFISLPLTWFTFDGARAKGLYDTSMATFPSPSTILWQVGVCLLVEDFMFYWSHRLLHIPFLFRHIHKIHHQHHYPIGIASEYAHPVEYYFGNLLPSSVGPLLVKPHMFTYLLWIGVRLLKTLEAHCGYSFPFSPFQFLPFANPAAAHDYHHSRGINTCYGSFLQFWDTTQGTNKDFSSGNKSEFVEFAKTANNDDDNRVRL